MTLFLTIAVYLLILPLIAFIWNGITLYNSLVQVRLNVDVAWANIDVLLKRRHDELDKLIDAVKSYMGYEKDVLERLTQLRGEAVGMGAGLAQMRCESEITPTIGRLFIAAEKYPQLRASENFMQLQREIMQLETQIAHRRELYNDAVNVNNARMEQFPASLLATIAGLRQRRLFIASDEEKQAFRIAL